MLVRHCLQIRNYKNIVAQFSAIGQEAGHLACKKLLQIVNLGKSLSESTSTATSRCLIVFFLRNKASFPGHLEWIIFIPVLYSL